MGGKGPQCIMSRHKRVPRHDYLPNNLSHELHISVGTFVLVVLVSHDVLAIAMCAVEHLFLSLFFLHLSMKVFLCLLVLL